MNLIGLTSTLLLYTRDKLGTRQEYSNFLTLRRIRVSFFGVENLKMFDSRGLLDGGVINK